MPFYPADSSSHNLHVIFYFSCFFAFSFNWSAAWLTSFHCIIKFMKKIFLLHYNYIIFFIYNKYGTFESNVGKYGVTLSAFSLRLPPLLYKPWPHSQSPSSILSIQIHNPISIMAQPRPEFHVVSSTPPFLRVKRLSDKAVLPSRASPSSGGYDLFRYCYKLCFLFHYF